MHSQQMSIEKTGISNVFHAQIIANLRSTLLIKLRNLQLKFNDHCHEAHI